MRTLNATQQAIISSNIKNNVKFLFEIDVGNTGSIDYYFAREDFTYSAQLYSYKIKDHSPLTIATGYLGDPKKTYFLPLKININVLFPNAVLDGNYASDFEGASITVRLVCSSSGYSDTEILSWRYIVKTASSIDDILNLQCTDFLHSGYLEGGYPDSPVVSDILPSNATPNDSKCVPEVLGTCYPALRPVFVYHDSTQTITRTSDTTFTLAGDFTGQYVANTCGRFNCGVDGLGLFYVQSSSFAAGTTTVTVATSGTLTASLESVTQVFYLLGVSSPTYTITEVSAPIESNSKTVFTSAFFTFVQAVITGADSNTYKVFQPLIIDTDSDGTDDFSPEWGVPLRNDMPAKFSRSDLSALTNPASIAEYLFEEFGVPSAEIDSTLQTAAEAVFSGRSFALNIPLNESWDRESLLCKLFTVSGMRLNYRDKLGFSVLTKTSQKTLTYSDVYPHTFRSTKSVAIEDEKDIGYMVWQSNTVPNYEDNFVKKGVAVKSATTNFDDTVIECDWVNTETNALKATKLALQRSLLKKDTITFIGYSHLIALEPGDMITINDTFLGKEAASYDVMITKMVINNDLSINFEAIRFRDALDDWGDISPTSASTVTTVNTETFKGVISGPRITGTSSGVNPNEIEGVVIISSTGEITNQEDYLTGVEWKASSFSVYDDANSLVMQCVTSGTDVGDVIIGDYSGGTGLKWDKSAGSFKIVSDSAEALLITGGGDIKLVGNNTNPARINFEGTGNNVEMGTNTAGSEFDICPDSSGVNLYLGAGQYWATHAFDNIYSNASANNVMLGGSLASGYNGARVFCYPNATGTPYIQLRVRDNSLTADEYYSFYTSGMYLSSHKALDLAASGAAWAEAYADNWNNVADYFFLDSRNKGKTKVNDLEVLCNIKPSGVYDPKTGLELIDDNTLPEWILSKDKNGKTLYDPEGKPYISTRAMDSLLMGAIRQIVDRLKMLDINIY